MIRDIDEVIVVQRCVKILIQALINRPCDMRNPAIFLHAGCDFPA